MCDTCGCNVTQGNRHLLEPGGRLEKTGEGNEAVTVLRNLLHENDHMAAHNREHLDRQGVLTVNLMSSPGSGKTALLEATLEALSDQYRIAVIEGDLETENDAERVRARGAQAVQITTGSACHLDAHMVHNALHRLDLEGVDLLFVENVGNLVCPASFDLGQHANVALLSAPEGDDKPAKYPVMFRAADLILLSKADLLPVLDDFSPARAREYVRQLANPAPVHEVSVRRTGGIDAWLGWLRDRLAAYRERRARQPAFRPVAHGGSGRSQGLGS